MPLDIEVECLTDESGTGHAVALRMGREKVYSKWTRKTSAEKLARTLRDAFDVHGDDDTNGVQEASDGR